MKYCIFFTFAIASNFIFGQPNNQSVLTIDNIMRNPQWIGTSPKNIFWADDSKTVYFDWNPDKADFSALYMASVKDMILLKVNDKNYLPSQYGVYNKARTKKVYEKNGDIFFYDCKSNKIKQITNTIAWEQNPTFNFKEDKILYQSNSNLFSWDMTTGQINQLTNFQKPDNDKQESKSDKDEWLSQQQLQMFDVLKKRKDDEVKSEKLSKSEQPKRPKLIDIGKKYVSGILLSPDENFITFKLSPRSNNKRTIVPNYVTESGYVEDINARSKVGDEKSISEMKIYNIAKDTVYSVVTDSIIGMFDLPAYTKDYPNKKYKKRNRTGYIQDLIWSDDGKNCVFEIRANDNKDRWILTLDLSTGHTKLVDRQHDEAWIEGPAVDGKSLGWLPDNRRVWFLSEESGYSHIYTFDIISKKKTALTSGNFEVSDVQLSNDKKFWYFSSNMKHPGELQFYKMPVDGGKITQLTQLEGVNHATLSMDEKYIAFLHSTTNRPDELYLMENIENAKAHQITNSVSEEFKTYNWRTPEIKTIKARDGVDVYLQIFEPEKNKKNNAAVIFIHGAGYLQNVDKGWSYYFREYMFHNLLVDNGYTVMNIDYRGSAGYGRDFRDGIYRNMGGKDLTDVVDAVKWMNEKYGIDSKKVGIYGGSYGGFLTLMAMFKEPDIFNAGAALRSVTDWAHYNQWYSGNILNTPSADSLAYIKSSPIYYADGLKGHLLMLHGMVDDNVHFQDIVRLTQRLIELRKDNWELAVYPVESHSFEEPTSWADEYKRIFKFFNLNLFKN